MAHDLPYSHTVPYFKTSRAASDSWIGKTKDLLKRIGATDLKEGFLAGDDFATFALSFRVGADSFRVAWPVLPVKDPRDEPAARVQAATLVYHECKARCLAATILGPRPAFVSYLLLSGGKTVMESTSQAIETAVRSAGFLEHKK